MGLRRSVRPRHRLGWRLGLVIATATISLAVPAIANAAPPDGVTAIAQDGRVELAWQPAAGAASYRIYRGTTPTTVTTQVATGVITTTFGTDTAATNGTTFYYSVRAVIGGVESPDSRLAEATPRARTCSTGNPIVIENCFPGTIAWSLANPATVNGIEGYATAQSINKGESVNLKVNSPVGYRIEIYRSGYYQDTGGRLISAIRGIPGGAQPACTTDTQTGLVDCANWSTSATLTTTASWPTGVYLLRLVRDDNGADSHILLVVRDDARVSDVLYGVGFTDFQAYNGYLGKSLYDFNSNGANTVSGTPRAVKVSFDRPYKQAIIAEPNWYTKIEHQAVSWLELSGYDVSYQADSDLERNPASVNNHRVYILPSHDEYYSAGMRTALEQARDNGINLFSMGANQVYWKIRFENGPGGPNRIQVCYKSTQSGGPDPSGIPTGTWRDPAGANKPENALLGAMYVGDNDQGSFPLRVPAADGADRLYRYTGLDAQSTGTSTTIGTDLVGWEWDARVANGFEPAGVKTLASSPASGQLLTDAGRVYAPGSATVNVVKYQAASGALVVHAGTNQWDRGLGRTRVGDGTFDTRIRQFTTNALADMGAVPSTPTADVTADDPSGALIAAPTGVAAVAEGSDLIRITWNAVAGATGYRVYRHSSARTAGVPVGTLASGTPVVGTSFADFGLNSGATYYYIVTAVKGSVQSPFSSQVSATTQGSAGGTTVRINAGGGAYTSALGRVYSADTNFTGGAGFQTINPVSGTTDPALYQNERWGQFTYSIPVANGVYDVRLHFVELYYGTEVPGCAGKRIFGMDVLDTPGVDIPATMDVCAQAGVRTALVKIISGVQITDGTVDVRSVYGSIDDPELAAIEVVPGNAGPPTVTSTVPSAGATGVSTTAPVTATFSRGMDATTITGSTFTLTGPSGAVPAAVTYDSATQTARLAPSAALAFSTSYTATVTTGAKASDGTALAAPVTWSFTTAAPVPPTVTSTTPAAGATGVATNTSVTAVFSKAMNATTISGTSFTLTGPSGGVPATVSYNAGSQTATLAPTSALANSTTYTARLEATIRASDGVALAAAVTWTFTTAAPPPPPDTTPPTSAITAPTGGTVSGTVNVTADATDNIAVAGVQFKLDGANLGTEDTASPYSISWASTTAANGNHVLTAVARDTSNNTTTSASVTVNVQNTGPPPGTTTTRINTGGAAFTTGGGQAFQADGLFTGGSIWTSSAAIAGTTDDALYQNERWGQFSYAIPVTNGAYDVRFHFVELFFNGACTGKRIFGMNIVDTPGTDITNLDVCAAVGPNAALVRTITGVNVTDGTLNISSVYGSIDDPEVAAIEVVPATGPPPPPAPPTVTSRTPAAGATGVAPNTTVTAVFSRAMDATTITTGTFTVSPPAGPAVAATVTYNATTLTATLTPSAALAVSTTYTARLDPTIKASDGTALAAAVTWTFTTAAAPPPPDTTPPTSAITAPTGGTVTGTINVNANATDNVAVAGVQFKLDGANLGTEDTTSPYSVSWNTTSAANGNHVLTAVARDTSNNTTTSASVTVNVQNTGPPPGTTTTRINAGGAAFTTGTGQVFQADGLFTGGATWTSTSAIAGTTDDALYQNERWGQFSYAIPVTNGLYDVRFHFVELYYGTVVTGPCVGKRIFGMNIVDTPATDITNLDVCAAVGPNAALVRTITGVNVTDGTLNISSVYGSIDDPELAAVEVVPAS